MLMLLFFSFHATHASFQASLLHFTVAAIADTPLMSFQLSSSSSPTFLADAFFFHALFSLLCRCFFISLFLLLFSSAIFFVIARRLRGHAFL